MIAMGFGFGTLAAASGVNGISDKTIPPKSNKSQQSDTSPSFKEYDPNAYEKTIFKQNAKFEPFQVSPPTAQEAANYKPVIRLMGLDGVGWPVLNEFFRTNQLLWFKHLVRSGASAVFLTDVGLTPVSCTTITSGKERFKHGILNHEEAGHSPFDYTWRAVKVPRLWQMLEYHNYSVTYGGFLLTDDHPRLLNTIDMLRPFYEPSTHDAIITFYSLTDGFLHQFLFPFLLDHSVWGKDYSIDALWRGFNGRAVEQLTRTFSEVDVLIGELVSCYPQDILIIFSDHGQSPASPGMKATLCLPELFQDHNVTEAQTESCVINGTIKATVTYTEQTFKYAEDLKNGNELLSYIYVPTLNLEVLNDTSQSQHEDISKSLLGLVSLDVLQADGRSVLAKLSQELLTYHENGYQVFYKDSHNNFTFTEGMVRFIINDGPELRAIKQVFHSGEHGPQEQGILIAYGPPFRAGVVTSPVSLADFTPTVLYAAGLPVGRDMDGRVAQELFRPEFLSAHDILFLDSYDSVIPLTTSPGEVRQLSPEEVKQYKDKGYPGVQ